jgi:hypothetical protein
MSKGVRRSVCRQHIIRSVCSVGRTDRFADVAARELDADDVAVLGKLCDQCKVEVDAAADSGEVVEQDGDGRRVGDLRDERPGHVSQVDPQSQVKGSRQPRRTSVKYCSITASVMTPL